MNIEAGKFYQTRDGRKVRIYATDGQKDGYPIHGAVLYVNGWEVAGWHSDGTWIKGGRRGLDIIAPWIEKPIVDWSAMPKWAKWVAMDKNGEWFWSDAPPRKSKDIWECSCNTDIIPPEYAPKYEGPWEDSLVERPEGE